MTFYPFTLVAAGGGSVSTVSGGDTSIVATNPAGPAVSLITGTLDVLAALHPAAAAVGLNGQKITGQANGTAATDSAAFGQIPLLDGNAADIAPPGLRAAGAVGKAADAGHIHAYAEFVPADYGMFSWTYDPASSQGSTVLTPAGTLFVSALKLAVAVNVTNIIMFVGVAGAGLTAGQCFAALYQGAGGALLGVTADQSGAWASGGLKTMAIAGGPVAVAAGIVYVAFWFNGTTGPSFSRGDGSAGRANFNLALAASRGGTTGNTGLTTTAPGTLGAITAQGLVFLAGLS